MQTTTTAAETDVRAFADRFGHLPNVGRLIAACEAGDVTWPEAAIIARRALASGLDAAKPSRAGCVRCGKPDPHAPADRCPVLAISMDAAQVTYDGLTRKAVRP